MTWVKQILPSTMGREMLTQSRGTTQISRARPLRLAGHFVLTSISLPGNAGTAVRTTKRETYLALHPYSSRGNFDWFQLSAGFSQCHAPLWQLSPVYFPLSVLLLGSPVNLYYLQKWAHVKAGIYSVFTQQNQAHKKQRTINGIPRDRSRGSQDQLRGRREFQTKRAIACSFL